MAAERSKSERFTVLFAEYCFPLIRRVRACNEPKGSRLGGTDPPKCRIGLSMLRSNEECEDCEDC